MNIENQTYKFLKENYDYLYLLNQFRRKAKDIIITGSSHGLLGVDMHEMPDSTVNLSMHSQDIYYAMLSVKKFLESHNKLSYCILTVGYYIPFQDLSRAGSRAFEMIEKCFYPIYGDLHHLKNIKEEPLDFLWGNMPVQSIESQEYILEKALRMMSKRTSYICDLYCREPYFKFDKQWRNLSEDDRMYFGKIRAKQHNKHLEYHASYYENENILMEMRSLINQNDGKFVILIPPFSEEYRLYLDKEMVSKATKCFRKYADYYIDYNEENVYFDEGDFVDTDHLNGRGAYKLSHLIKESLF